MTGTDPQAATSDAADVEFQKGPSLSNGRSCFCIGFGFIRIRAILVCLFEFFLLFYQLISSLIIIIKPWPSEDTLRWAWFSQPYLAWIWEAPGWRGWLAAANIIFVLVYIVAIKMFFHALYTDNPKWALPHLIMQAFTVVLMVFLSLFTLLTLRGHGQGFAMQVVRITGSSMSSGVSGIGSVLFGIEEFDIQAAKKSSDKRPTHRQFIAFLNRTRGYSQSPVDSIISNRTTLNDAGRKDLPSFAGKQLPSLKSNSGGPVRRTWGLYTPGISMLVALIVYLSITGLSFPFFIVILQCYYFLVEIEKAKRMNILQNQQIICAPLSDA